MIAPTFKDARAMNVLVFNCGSSSLKYRLISMPQGVELAGGEAQRIGPPTAQPSRIVYRVGDRAETLVVTMADHAAAFDQVMRLLTSDPARAPHAIGHRMVHGGTLFLGHAILDAAVLAGLETLGSLAPIHNPPATALARVCLARYPQLPQVVVFDTAFHATIPEYARTYALPRNLRDAGLRKFGFHGTSHRYVAEEAARLMGRPLEDLSAVSCHLGSGGASLCAIVGGRSIDNTMGYSPLQGLVMSTRCGDLDPAVTLHLLALSGGDFGRVEKLLNQQSGVLGVSGVSADIRDILALSGQKQATPGRARQAEQVYLWRLRKYLGAYLATVGRADAVLFTDTIGETLPVVRWAMCSDMEHFGLKIDADRNAAATVLPADVATDDSPVRILVIQTNEELAIARFTYEAVRPSPAAGKAGAA
jgi:acetate kinase